MDVDVRRQIVVAAVVLGMGLLLGLKLLGPALSTTPRQALETSPGPAHAAWKPPPVSVAPKPVTITEPPAAKVVVHVAGKVKAPGVYTLPPTARVIDAVKAAGGSKPDAVLDAVNLAAHLVDGEQIYLPGKSEAVLPQASPSPAPTASASPGAAESRARVGRSTAGRRNEAAKPTLSGKIDINRAGASELEKLPGVGPATASSIIEYRKAAGGFAKPEDIMNVKGIGPKKFGQIQRHIVVR